MEEKETAADRRYNRIAAMLLILIAMMIVSLGGIAMLLVNVLH